MNIIDRIKNFWKNRNIKSLPEAQMSRNISNTKNKNWFITNSKYYQESKLDKEIDDFLQSYSNAIEQADMNQPIDNYRMAYRALVTLNGKPVTQEQYDNNSYRQQELLNQLYSTNRYSVEKQGNATDPAFYHIKSNGYQMPKFENMVRVYVNCNNANISELAHTILNYNNNQNFYMKFTSNNSNVQNPRGEKIVIYCDKNELNYTLQLLEYTKNIRPDLFLESEKTLPFLQSVNGIASVSAQPMTDRYVNLYGYSKRIPQSTNAFLANVLEESYMEAAREIARADSNLAFLLNEENINDETLYMKNYPYINSNYHEYLLKSMEAKMAVLSQRNDLYIDGIYQQMSYNNKEKNLEEQR